MAVPKDKELDALLKKYVCVRVVQMYGLDINRYQFDGAMTWAIFLLNADGTMYGRYGTRSANGMKAAQDISLAGFKKTLKGALVVHEAYASNPDTIGKSLAGKIGPKSKWKKAEEIPFLKNMGRFQKRFEGTGGRNNRCIHCHMVPQFEMMSLRQNGDRLPDRLFWPYPLPDEIGLHMDPREMATIETVKKGSPAGKAGFRPGDEIVGMKGQIILSTADIQFVLNFAGDPETIETVIERDGEEKTLRLKVEEGWRYRIGDFRRLNLGLQYRLLGFNSRPVSDANREELGFQEDELALRVGRLPRRFPKNINLRARDIIIAVDGRKKRWNLGAYTAYLMREKKKGSTLKLTIRRGEKEHEVEMKVE